MPWTILLLSVLVAGATVALGGFSPGSVPGKDIVEGRVDENAPAVTATPTPTPTAVVPGTFGTVRGRLTYEDPFVNVDASGAATDVRINVVPIRFTDVVALDAAKTTVISRATVSTDVNGVFALEVPADTPFFVAVLSRVNTSRANLEGRTFAGALYMIATSRTGGTTADTVGNGSDVTFEFPRFTLSNPGTGILNILDAALRGSDRVTGLAGSIPPIVTFFWERTERRGTFFTSTGGPNGGPAITINGGDLENDDTNEFDDGVILHEYGHFVAFAFSRDSSLGGPHALSDVTNPPLAYSEGFASFFFGLTDNTPFLTDTAAINGATFIGVINLEGGRGAASPTVPRGVRSEATVFEVLWDLVDGVENRQDLDGDALALTAAGFFAPFRALRDTNRYVTINDYLELLVASGAVSAADVNTVLVAPEDQIFRFPPVAADVVPVPIVNGGATTFTVQTRAQADGRRFTLDVTNKFFVTDISQRSQVTANLSFNGGATDANNAGTNVDLVLLTANNALATDFNGSVVTPLSPSPQTNGLQVVNAILLPGRYILWVHGRPDVTTSLVNATTRDVSVSLNLIVQPAP